MVVMLFFVLNFCFGGEALDWVGLGGGHCYSFLGQFVLGREGALVKGFVCRRCPRSFFGNMRGS